MCFSVGVGRNALPWFQPSDSGKEIVLHQGARVASDAPKWPGSRVSLPYRRFLPLRHRQIWAH